MSSSRGRGRPLSLLVCMLGGVYSQSPGRSAYTDLRPYNVYHLIWFYDMVVREYSWSGVATMYKAASVSEQTHAVKQ